MQKYVEDAICELEKQILDEVEMNPKGWKMKFKVHPEYEEFLNWKFPKIINEPLTTKVTWLRFGLTDYPVCPICQKQFGKGMKIGTAKGYPKHCSVKCAQLDHEVKKKQKRKLNDKAKSSSEKYKKTCLARYGVENIFAAPEIKEKIQNCPTCINNIRHKHAWQTIQTYKDFVIPMFNFDELEPFSTKKTYKWKCMKCKSVFEDHIHKTMHVPELPYLPRCWNCFPTKRGYSKTEGEFRAFCKSYFPNSCNMSRFLIPPYEIDILIPEIKLALEFNGIFWHSEEGWSLKHGTSNGYFGYNLNKIIRCNDLGYRLLIIWEDEWKINRKSIETKLDRIFRKCEDLNFSSDKIYLNREWFNGISIPGYELIQTEPPKIIERSRLSY